MAFALRMALSCVFLYALSAKVFDPAAGEGGFARFARLIQQHDVVPRGWSYWAATTTMCVEAVLALLFLVPRPPRITAWMCVCIVSFFSFYIVTVSRKQGFVECACFGQVGPTSLAWGLVRNTAIGLAAIAWWWLARHDVALPRQREGLTTTAAA